MYRNCFCVKVTPTVTTASSTGNINDMRESTVLSFHARERDSVPPIPPARRQYSQFGQYKYPNYPSSSGSDTRAGRMAQINARRTGVDENNKRFQCEECKHEDYFEWCWDKTNILPATSVFAEQNRNILFNPGFSVGTGAVRGSKPLELGKHHYFEILMNTEVYGTDMMIGVGTDKVNLQQFAHSFVHFLGYDNESWGLSYSGDLHHGGQVRHYSSPFSQGTYIGVHVDLWAGTLEYYINRRPCGIAFTGLQHKTLYPMISSTSARSGMNLTYCRSYTPTLQLHALLALGKSSLILPNTSVATCEHLPPGLKAQIKKQFWWISGGKHIDPLFALLMEADKENQEEQEQQQKQQQQSVSKSVTVTVTNPIKVWRRKKVLPSPSVGAAAADGEATGPSGSGSDHSAVPTSTTSTSSAIPESHSNGGDGDASPGSSDSESRDSKRIRLRSASIIPTD